MSVGVLAPVGHNALQAYEIVQYHRLGVFGSETGTHNFIVRVFKELCRPACGNST